MKIKAAHLSIELTPVLDANGLRERLNLLILDSMQDPLDRFNLHQYQVEVVKDVSHDWNYEYYIIQSNRADVGYVKLLKRTAEREVSIAFYLKEGARGKGILKACTEPLGERIFNQLGYNRISTSCTDLNEPAKKLYNEIFRHEGTRRQSAYYGGKYVDEHVFGLLKSESRFASKAPPISSVIDDIISSHKARTGELPSATQVKRELAFKGEL